MPDACTWPLTSFDEVRSCIDSVGTTLGALATLAACLIFFRAALWSRLAPSMRLRIKLWHQQRRAGSASPSDLLKQALRLAWVQAAVETTERVAKAAQWTPGGQEKEQAEVIGRRLQELRRSADAHGDEPAWEPIDALRDHVLDVEPTFLADPQALPADDPISGGFVGVLAGLAGCSPNQLPAVYHPASLEAQAFRDKEHLPPLARRVLELFSELARGDPLKAFYADLLAGHQLARAPRSEVPRFDWDADRLDFTAYLDDKLKHFVGREWLFERITTLADDPAAGRPPILLVAGFGTGKTAAMGALMRQWVPDSPTAVRRRCSAWHFCRYDADETLNPGRIVVSLARQLAGQIEAYRQLIDANPTLQTYLVEARAEPLRAAREAVFEPLRRLNPPHDVFICIDALDESEDIRNAPGWQGVALLDLLQAAQRDAPPCMRLLLSSRNIDDIKSARMRDTFHRLDLDQVAPRAQRFDMVSYAEQRARTEAPIQHFLRDAGRSPAELVDKLTPADAQGATGGFLLLRSVMDGIVKREITGQQFDELPARMDAFYERAFDVRIRHLDIDQVRAVLGIVATARLPLKASVIGRILEPDGDSKTVEAIFKAFGGLLVRDRFGGITFAHFSLENWLRGDIEPGLSSAGDFAIDRQASERAEQRLVAYCGSAEHGQIDPDADFHRYLRLAAVPLLVKHGRFGPALRLLRALREHLEGQAAFLATGDDLSLLAQHADGVVQGLRERWRTIDGAAPAQRLPARQTLTDIDAGNLRHLLLRKRYATGMYVPVLRTMIECCPEEWPAILDEVLASHNENDIVFRHDTGVAHARAWRLATTPDEQQAFLDRITAMAHAQDDPHAEDRREIAGYALKYVCQQTDPQVWWGRLLDTQTLQPLARHYATGDSATDRMVAGEMLLALALHGVPVTTWWEQEEACADFWNPCWPNLGADIDSIHVALSRDRPVPPRPGRYLAPQGLCESTHQHDLAAQWMRQLRDREFVARCQLPAPWATLLRGPGHQQNDIALDDEASVRALARALRGGPGDALRDDAILLIKLVMLHPQWNVTERVSALVAAIVLRDDAHENLFELLSEAPEARIRYGAIDAAFAYGEARHKPDSYGAFFRLLLRRPRPEDAEPNCRVRGIGIDDLDGWLREAPDGAIRTLLQNPDFVTLVQTWLATADDIWLIEYLHTVLHFLHHDKQLLEGSALDTMLSDPAIGLSPCFPDQNVRFYLEDGAAFLAAVEHQRREAWLLATTPPKAG